MSRGRKLLIGLGLIAVFLATIWAYINATLDMNPLPSTYSVSPSGCKAIYISMDELNYPVHRFLKSYKDLKKFRGTLVVIDPWPIWRGFSKTEIEALKDWIKEGNRLALFAGSKSLSLNTNRKPGKGKKKKAFGKYVPLHNRLGLRLKDTDSKGRSPVAVRGEYLDWDGMITVSNEIRWDEPQGAWALRGKDKHGPLWLERTMGSGEVVAISDDSLLSNERVGEQDNFRFLLSIVNAPSASESVLFDEFHHGYGSVDTVSTFFKASVFYVILAQLLILALFYFYSKRAMLAGAIRSLERPKGEATTGYVESMANIFESLNAGSQALSALLESFQTELRSRHGIRFTPGGGSTGPAITGGGYGTGKDPNELEKLMDECRQAVEEDADVKSSLKLAARLARIRKELRTSGSG